MNIYLIRHGESTGDIEERFGGDYDDHLTPHGIKQAQALAKELIGKGIEKIYVSPRIRALETAAELAAVLQIPTEVIEDLRERNNYGVMTGLTKEEARENYPDDFAKISQDKTYHSVTGSERYEEIKKRALTVFTKITNREEHTIAIITHGGIISTLVREILMVGKNIKLEDCAYLEIEKTADTYSVRALTRAELK